MQSDHGLKCQKLNGDRVDIFAILFICKKRLLSQRHSTLWLAVSTARVELIVQPVKSCLGLCNDQGDQIVTVTRNTV